jgi:hypothetical protein
MIPADAVGSTSSAAHSPARSASLTRSRPWTNAKEPLPVRFFSDNYNLSTQATMVEKLEWFHTVIDPMPTNQRNNGRFSARSIKLKP